MKKHITLIIALAFAVALAICGSTAAFAAEDTNTLDWYFHDEFWEYDLVGEAKIGKTVIPGETDGYTLAYDLSIPETGYYLLSFSVNDFDWVGFPEEITNGTAYNIGEYYWIDDAYTTRILYHLEKGKTYVGVDRYYNDDETFFEIEFMGSEIKDLAFGKNAFKDYIIHSDIYWSCTEECNYVAYEDTVVTFNTNKTVEIKDCELNYSVNNDAIIIGKNDITVDFLGFEKSLVLTACEVTDFIEKIEMTNIEDYCTVSEYYDGYAVPEIYNEEITVYFTDGTKTTADFEYGYAYVRFPNGRSYDVYAEYYVARDDQVTLTFYAAWEEISSYECEIESSDFLANIMLLNENKIEILRYTERNIRHSYADYIWYSDNTSEFIQGIPNLIKNCYDYGSWSLSALAESDYTFMYHTFTGDHVYNYIY